MKMPTGVLDFMHRDRICGIVAAMLLFLFGCASTEAGNTTGVGNNTPASSGPVSEARATPAPTPAAEATATPVPEAPFTPYQAPEFAGSFFHADLAEGDGNVELDLSAVGQGYVAVGAKADSRLKFLVVKGDITYQYNIASDGTPSIFPLQSGDGVYTFQVMKQLPNGKYSYYYVSECNVKLEDEFQPFLRPSDYVNYSADSKCVKKAAELAAKEEDALGVVTAVFEYICSTTEYDNERAVYVETHKDYLPDPDEILDSGKGICFDYAALGAAMLRSQGIPTKMVWGNVSSGKDYVYHAWNLFYTEETGWVSVEYAVKADSWNRLDLTFSAGGADSSFVGDGENYSDMYYY